MEMRAGEDIQGMGEDLTSQLPPVAYSLSCSFLDSHCSSCFRSLHLPSQSPQYDSSTPVRYCSLVCFRSDYPRHVSSAEHHLFFILHSRPSTWDGETSDLRTTLRLLLFFDQLRLPFGSDRIGGLMSNRENLKADEIDEISSRIREGGRLLSMARRMRDGKDLTVTEEEDTTIEETALCQVLTNAVEVQVNEEHSIGIAVYGTCFSWINHSCSPNACYRFSLIGSEMSDSNRGESTARIAPFGDENILRTEKQLNDGFYGYGPRISLRSIKPITKDEEVCIGYTDLLQPTARRQSELWSSYRFVCCCRRCSALPPTYTDRVLQGNVSNTEAENSRRGHDFCSDEAYNELTNYLDETISEYLLMGNPKSCCEKLENMLICRQEQLLPKEQSWFSFKLCPLHHLSLSACIALASAYKVRAINLIASNWSEGFELSRTSVAYSLLVAGVVHHLFLSEPSLIVTTTNFWIDAGKSLLSLAQSLISYSTINQSLSNLCHSSLPKCVLMDKFEAGKCCSPSQSISTLEFEEITQIFFNCASRFSSKVWPFLIHGRDYFKDIKDPVDLNWLETTKRFVVKEGTGNGCDAIQCTHDERESIFQLGTHCLLYGWYLASICYGRSGYLTCYVKDLLCRRSTNV